MTANFVQKKYKSSIKNPELYMNFADFLQVSPGSQKFQMLVFIQSSVSSFLFGVIDIKLSLF